MEIKIKPFQDHFLFSTKRFPALIAGIGTGKTYMMLLKIWRYCETYPDSLALIVRKTFTDLRDSTLKDFTRYFQVSPDSNGEYKFPNGSAILFRHGDQMPALKNLNLSIVGIEQAEEFETDDQFQFLRDRLRRENAPYRQCCVISNANGHNWIYKNWIYQPPSNEYDVSQATTFDNADNLPKDFIEDLRAMEKESPHHYQRYVMNSHEEAMGDDLLLTGELVYPAAKLEFSPSGYNAKILSCDVARFGEDESVFTIIQQNSMVRWEMIFQDSWQGKDTMQIAGRIMSLAREFDIENIAIDDIGVGGGVTDRLMERSRFNVLPFNSAQKAGNDEKFSNRRSEGYFKLHDLLSRGHLKILDDPKLMEQLLAIRFKYMSNGTKAIVSKDEMRKKGWKSPDRADSLMMGIYYTNTIENDNISGFDHRHPPYSPDKWDPFDGDGRGSRDKWNPWQ